MRAIVVDDEPLAREMIKEYLEAYPHITVVAECTNGRKAVQAIKEKNPDLVFLDIQMPGLNGFEVLAHLDDLPQIIFSTAFDEFAIQAFETGAIDYLLKPYNRERFDKAVQRVLNHHQRTTNTMTDQVLHLLDVGRSPTQAYAPHLFVRTGDRIVPVQTADLLWVEAAGDYSQLHTHTKTHLCNLGIGALEKRLDPAKFVRVHRSTIIALRAIAHIVSDGEGGYMVTLQDATRVRVSRSYAPKVRALIV